MKLAIISHTEHYIDSGGSVVGWGPTVTEINHLLELFDEIYHLAMLKPGNPPPSALPYTSEHIHFVPIPAVGGPRLGDKIKIILKLPKTLNVVSSILKKTDVFQFRAPTGIGVYLIPYLSLFVRKKGWFKYAGNWNQSNPPLGYRLQRWWLKKQKRVVTINGKWPDQPAHCLTFENPCLSQSDLISGMKITNVKNFQGLFRFCFVGRLEKEKGVDIILKALTGLSIETKNKIFQVDFVGNGKENDYFHSLSEKSGLKINFHGFLPRDAVFTIFKEAHFILLPTTASEGFPKVIAEAMNFGCLPIVSNVSSIGQYIIEGKNGFIINPPTIEKLANIIEGLTIQDPAYYNELVESNKQLINFFSFCYYNQKILNNILN